MFFYARMMYRNTINYFLRVNPKQIWSVQSYLEGIEGCGVVRTVDPDQGFIKIWVAPDFADELLLLLEDMRQDWGWEWVTPEQVEQNGAIPL